MKKSIFIVALTLGALGTNAQDLTSKKGEPILPESGDWAISMSADPLFTYLGNAFNGSQNHAGPNTNFLGNQTIIGKKFIDEKNAYRVIVRVGFTSKTNKNLVINDAQTGSTINFPDQQEKVTDKQSIRNTNIALGVGKEMRRGKTRLQGYYGAEVMIWVASSSEKYKYGNLMSEANVSSTDGSTQTTTPTTTGTRGRKRGTPSTSLASPPIGGADAGEKILTAPLKPGRTRTASHWNGAAFSRPLTHGMRKPLKSTAPCCAD